MAPVLCAVSLVNVVNVVRGDDRDPDLFCDFPLSTKESLLIGGVRHHFHVGPVAKDLARRCFRVERAAKRGCPVDTGRLRSSINWRLARDGRGLLGIVGTNDTYAPYVEFGTTRTAAQPYLRPALQAAT
jgi:hypothetical protein